MRLKLSDKTILIISPQPWGKLYNSKQHYAQELAKRGNTIYFVNPPDTKMALGIQIESLAENADISIVQMGVPIPYRFKFHYRTLYDKVLNSQLKRLLKKINKTIDIVWDFDCNSWVQDLSIFNAELNIFHPVDQGGAMPKNKSADILFSLSQEILDTYKSADIPKYFINHGLGGALLEQAKTKLENRYFPTKGNEKIKVGYIGNLLIPALDQDVLMQLIKENPSVEFHLIGPYEHKGNNITGQGKYSEATKTYITFLKNQLNVILYGPKGQKEIPEIVKNCDAFLLCYQKRKNYNLDNSHKILEYLSTGKVVIGNYISTYKNKRELIQMLAKDELSTALLPLFKSTIESIDVHNTASRQEDRISFALENSYSRQIERIEDYINLLKSSTQKELRMSAEISNTTTQ